MTAPWGGNTPRCSTECPVAGSPKLFYQPEHTYTYTYSGKSHIHLKGVEGGVTETDWSKEVELSWITPCDMVIFIKNSKVDGAADQPTAKFLEKYPLVVALTDGRVQHVCTHPEDDVWSINIKKGIASAFQNSLPSNSTINSGQNITETDVVGKCPTHYEVEREGDKVIVKKEKNHLLCKERYPTPAETQMPWLKGPLPLEESKCRCKQEITNGIYSSIICEDKKVVRPSYGAYKYVEAKQESTLRYVSLSSQQPPAIPQDSLVRKSLRYSYHTLNKDPSMVAELDQTMTQICEKTKDVVERDAAALVAKAVQLLRRVPEEAVKQTLDKIRAGRYCQDHSKLESLFLDAVSFIHESGAVKVMVDELVSGRATVGRAALYTAAFYLQPRPCIHAMMALKPMFESSQPLPRATLAAASMVNTYCRHNHHCYEEAPVKSLAEALGNKLQRQCSPSADERTQKAALATLKALGNMGVMTQEVAKSVMTCVDTEGVKINIRVAAAQAFRQVKCERHTTGQLLSLALNPTHHTEVRIATYLVALRCAEQKDLQEFASKISVERNTQVRGFILSHLLNLQQSDDPKKENLRYLLSSIVLPRDFETDFRKYSRNIDMSYFAPSLGVGAGVESNIIYVPGSFVPRSVDFNFTAALEGISMNIGEVGVRLEGLEPVIEEVFGPEGYLQRTSFSQILTDITTFVEQEGSKIMEHFENSLRQKRSINFSTLSHFFSKIYGGERSTVAHADVFARLMGQEITFASLAGDLKAISADGMIESFFSYFDDILPQMKNLHINSARAAHINFDYTFPTIQGTPLKLQLNGTAVAGLKMQGNLNLADILSNWRNGETLFKIIPSLSVQVDGFVGYDSYIARTGIKTTNTISSSNGVSLTLRAKNSEELEVELDLPEKMELINVKSETYLMKSVRGSPDTKIIPPSMGDARVKRQSCINSLEPMLGLRLCYDVDVPDIFRSNSLPLGAPAVIKLSIEKAESSMKGYLLSAATQNKRGSKLVTMKVATPGSSPPREVEATLSYTEQEESFIVSARIRSSTVTSGVWVTIVNREDHRGVEAFVNFNSSKTTISRGIKLDLKTRKTSSEEEYEFSMYSSRNRNFPLESQIMESKFVKKLNGPEVSLDILSQTKNELSRYLDFNFEIGVDLRYTQYSRLPLPTKLRKFVFQSGMRGWQVTSFIHQTRDSGETAEHTSAFKIMYMNQDLISVNATQSMEGRLGHNLVVKTAATVKMGRTEYKTSHTMYFGAVRKGVLFEALRSGENKKIIDLKALYESSEQSRKVHILVAVPEYMKLIKYESQAVKQEQGRYNVKAALKHGDRVIFQAHGPITAMFFSPMTHLQTDINFNTIKNRPYRFSSVIKFTPQQQIISFDLKNEHGPIFTAEWDVKVEVPPKTVTIFKFLLPSLINYELDATINEGIVQINFENLLLPNSSSPRKLKGAVNIDVKQEKVEVDFAWDADRDTGKKIRVESRAIRSSSNPGQCTLQGVVVLTPGTYRYQLDLTGTNLLKHFSGVNSFNLQVQNPSEKTLRVEVKNQVSLQQRTLISNILAVYKSFDNKNYIFSNDLELKDLGTPSSYELDYNLKFTLPEGHETTVSTKTKHQLTSHDRVMEFKSVTSTPSMRRPLQVEFLSSTKDTSYNVIWKAGVDTPATMFSWEMDTYPAGGVKVFKSAFDATAIHNFLGAIVKMVGRQGQVYENLLIERPETTKSTTRTTEREDEHSSSEGTYMITFKSTHSLWDQESKYEGHINHPSLTRDIRVEVQYSVTGENMRGTIELDIFPDTADKITGTLQSTLVANNTVRVETSLTSKSLKVSPKFIIVTAYAPHTVGFDLMFQKAPSLPVSFQMSAKYDRVTDKDATAAFRVVTEEGPVVDIAGVMELEQVPECTGVKIKAVALTSVLGTYDIYSRLCRPAFIELITTKRGSQEEYITKFGFQTPNNIEASLSVGDKDQKERRAIAMTRLKLTSPVLVNLDLVYKKEQVTVVKNDVNEKYQRVMQSLDWWVNSIYQYLQQQAQQQGSHFPNPEILKLMNEAKLDLQQIYDGVIYGEVMPRCKALCKVLWGPTASYVRDIYFTAWTGLARVQREIESSLSQEIAAWLEEFRGFTETLMDVVVQTLRWVEIGELPEPMRRLIEQLEQTEIFRLVKTDVDTVIEHYQEEYEATKQVVAKVGRTFRQDLFNIREKIFQMPAVQRAVYWFITNYGSDRFITLGVEQFINFLLQEANFVSIKTERGHFKLEIPLHSPLYSLSQVLQEATPNPIIMFKNIVWSYNTYITTPVQDVIWAYYSLMPRQLTDLLPPYNRTAMVVGDTEILTFDGAVLRVPRSPCKVVLAAYASNKLTMAHPQPSAPPQITLSTRTTTVTIKPDFRVDVGGQEMSSSQQTQGDVTIQKTPREVNVTSPFITVRVFREERVVSVNVSGWTFGRLAGLLGTYDGEVGNDWMMSSGRKASTLQELVSSWQENQHCPTPLISPVNPATISTERVVQCHALLEIRSRCYPLVHPEPFIKMCHMAHQPCDVAQAYRTICSRKGVKDMFPIPC
ncbi:Vitellogenin-like 6 [Homarus americanus]|uniref:Vitellogenin-like 6 n=1 Tax=Homarus americanus TaxID=6706 RepID=A0A8J5MNW2_HOMAM|nr:Vitellogenin-like 6 [Homarus americanus]